MFDMQIAQYIDTHKEEFLQDLSKVIAVDSVKGEPLVGKPFGQGPAEALDVTLEIAEKYNLYTENWENYVGIVQLEAGNNRVLDILAHLDIVPVGEGWTKTEPLVMKEEEGRVYGRGTADDKGPALAALYALRAIKALGIPLKKQVRLVLGSDEESGSQDLKYYFSKTSYADMTFTPDAEFPVINIERGMYFGEMKYTEEKNVSSTGLISLYGGDVVNAVPSKCIAIIEGIEHFVVEHIASQLEVETDTQITVRPVGNNHLEITVYGTSSHSSAPQAGNNANTAMLALLTKLPFLQSDYMDKIHWLHVMFPHGDYRGRNAGIYMQDESSGEMCISLNLLRGDGHNLRAKFDARTPLCANEENLQAIGEKLRVAGFSFSGKRYEAHYVPEDSFFVQTLLRNYEKHFGEKGCCLSTGGGTYVHNIPGGVAFGCAREGVDNRMHGPDEFAEIEALLMSAKIFASAIIELCNSEKEMEI